MNPVEPFKYLWDGSEPGWVLIRISRASVSLSIAFGEGGPSVREIQALRAAISDFAALSATEVFARLRGIRHVELGEYDAREGRQVAARCRAQQLAVVEQVHDQSGSLLFNEHTQSSLVIEDESLNRRVIEEALRQGIPLSRIEA